MALWTVLTCPDIELILCPDLLKEPVNVKAIQGSQMTLLAEYPRVDGVVTVEGGLEDAEDLAGHGAHHVGFDGVDAVDVVQYVVPGLPGEAALSGAFSEQINVR